MLNLFLNYFNAIENGIVLLVSFLDCLLLVILYVALIYYDFAKLVYSSSFSMNSLGFSVYKINVSCE